MPPRQKKPLNYKCTKCSWNLSSYDKEELKEKGFTHARDSHDIVNQNYDWFMNHLHMYYDIS